MFSDGCSISQCPWYYNEIGLYESVFEINGALGARRAHFRGRAHVFQTCAPDVCTFIHSVIIAIY